MLRNLNLLAPSGTRILGIPQVGVRGDAVPAWGEDGPSLLYDDITLPGEAADLFRSEITVWPSSGNLFVYEDSSFSFTGAPDGAYTIGYRIWKNNVRAGTNSTADIVVGNVATIICSVGTAAATGVTAAINIASQSVTGATSAQANSAEAASVSQTQPITASDSAQANTSADGAISQDGTVYVGASNSAQANQVATGSIQHTHSIVAAACAIDNIASASSVVQAHLVAAANSAQANVASSASVGHFAPIAVIETIQLTSGVARSFTITSSSSAMPTVFSSDVGSEVVIDCLTDVSTSLVRKIISRRPDGAKVEWVADVHGTTTIRYIVLVGDLMPGRWKTQAYLEFPGGIWFGSITEFIVTRPI